MFTPQMGLLGSAIAFVGTHFLMSHPLRAPMVRAMGERSFRGVYSLVSLITFGAMIYFYRAIGREAIMWTAGDVLWIVATLLMWLGSILFVGSFAGNPALVGAPGPRGGPTGVLRITRHPMMWGFALWAIVSSDRRGDVKAVVFDGAILLLALGGSLGQDSEEGQALMGERWHEWTAQTAFIPFTRGLAYPGTVAIVGGHLTVPYRDMGCTRFPPASGAGSAKRAKARVMTRKFFGTDGIRGLTNREPMTARTALSVGMAAGAHFLRGDHRHRVVIGKDTRLSRLHDGIGDGRGLHQRRHGRRPARARCRRPAVAMLTRSMRADLGVMISASHNPFADNGIKLFGPDGYKLSDEDEQAIEKRLEQGAEARRRPS